MPELRTHPYIRIVVAACTLALASCASPPATPKRLSVSASLHPGKSIPTQIFKEINSYRLSQGAGELQRHAGLERLAQAHCEYLRDHRGTFKLYGRNVSHFGFEGRNLIARERHQMSSISENVVASSKVPGNMTHHIADVWKGSKDHHKNMLDDWTHTGIGVAVDSDGMVFATQIFSTMDHTNMSARERFNRF